MPVCRPCDRRGRWRAKPIPVWAASESAHNKAHREHTNAATQAPRRCKMLKFLKRERWYKTSSVMISLSIRPQSGPCFRSSFCPSVIRNASHCVFMDVQKSSKSQKVSTSRSNMRASTRWLDHLTGIYQDLQMINSIQTHGSGSVAFSRVTSAKPAMEPRLFNAMG